MRVRERMKVVSFKCDPKLHALLPMISSAHSGESIGYIIRQLLSLEAERLQLVKPGTLTTPSGRHRFRT